MMAPAAILNLPSNLFARSLSDSNSGSLSSSDTLDGAPLSTHDTVAKSNINLSTGASVAIAVIFVVFISSLILTAYVCVNRSRRRSKAASEGREVEMGSTIGDAESTFSMEKAGVKKPSRFWVPWRR
jgi:hypothetical protein